MESKSAEPAVLMSTDWSEEPLEELGLAGEEGVEGEGVEGEGVEGEGGEGEGVEGEGVEVAKNSSAEFQVPSLLPLIGEASEPPKP